MLDGEGNPFAWLHQVLIMEATCYGHVPLLGTLARRGLSLIGGPLKMNKSMERRMREKTKYTMATATIGRADQTTFEELAQVYGICPRALQAVDAELSQIPCFPYFYSHPILDIIMLKDN
jgi:hypothetical protein